MSRSDEYREIAKECIASARMSRSKQQRKQLLELAKTWMAAASLLDQGAETAAGSRQVGRIEVAAHGDALPRAEAIWRDEDACHVAAARALVSNEALVVGSRRDAQQLVHRALAPRA